MALYRLNRYVYLLDSVPRADMQVCREFDRLANGINFGTLSRKSSAFLQLFLMRPAVSASRSGLMTYLNPQSPVIARQAPSSYECGGIPRAALSGLNLPTGIGILKQLWLCPPNVIS